MQNIPKLFSNPRPYHSHRAGKHPTGGKLDLAMLEYFFVSLYQTLAEDGYLQEVFGYMCIDAGFVPGTAGPDVAAFTTWHLQKNWLWPPDGERFVSYTEDDLFDVIEFVYDCVSKPIKTQGAYHSFSSCGWHFTNFDRATGQQEYRDQVNALLAAYGDGYELNEDGEILYRGESGLNGLLEAKLPRYDPTNVENRVNAAVHKYRARASTWEDRREAVRDLAEVLEYIRADLKSVLSKRDEGDLFEIANNFGIRHHDKTQKTDYDPAWLSWIFYHYLATIHLALRLISERRDVEDG